MRTRVMLPLVGLLLFASAGASDADAASKRKKHRHADTYSQRYPHATPRQLRNLRGYERGEYYETYSPALPWGSKAWFEQREREGPRLPF